MKSDASLEEENPYAALARGWSQRLKKLERQNGALVITLLFMGLAIAALGASTLYLAFFRDPAPYVVHMNDENRVTFGGYLTERLTDRDDMIPSELIDFVEFWRSVTPDNAMQQKLVRRLHCMVPERSPAYDEMRDYYTDAESDPFKRNRRVSVEPRVATILKVTGQTWTVEWEEIARSHSGELLGDPVPFRANVIVSRGTPDDKCRQSNPAGVYVNQMSWTNAS